MKRFAAFWSSQFENKAGLAMENGRVSRCDSLHARMLLRNSVFGVFCLPHMVLIYFGREYLSGWACWKTHFAFWSWVFLESCILGEGKQASLWVGIYMLAA